LVHGNIDTATFEETALDVPAGLPFDMLSIVFEEVWIGSREHDAPPAVEKNPKTQ
jgi:hypothetical protein